MTLLDGLLFLTAVGTYEVSKHLLTSSWEGGGGIYVILITHQVLVNLSD